jgi:L-amino acid N-acyltransferase YncA
MIHVRRAGRLDAKALADLLNEIIVEGGTTAMTSPISAKDIQGWMAKENAIWHLAEDAAGIVSGFQWIAPHKDLPAGATDIASFVKIGKTGTGIGSALFEATRKQARDMGYSMIDAVIRADNTGGLAYYQSRGFETVRLLPDMALEDGSRVDKVWKRYLLR